MRTTEMHPVRSPANADRSIEGVNDVTDQAIIQLYWARDERAIRETDIAYGAYCRTISCTIVGNKEDAEECVNDTYLQAWNTIPPKKPEKLSAYLGRICRNLSINCVRKMTAHKRGAGEWSSSLDELEACVAGRDDPEKKIDEAALAASLERFVRALPERDQNLFLRRYYYLQPIAEAAAGCGMYESSAKVALHRIRKKLKAHLEREGIDT